MLHHRKHEEASKRKSGDRLYAAFPPFFCELYFFGVESGRGEVVVVV